MSVSDSTPTVSDRDGWVLIAPRKVTKKATRESKRPMVKPTFKVGDTVTLRHCVGRPTRGVVLAVGLSSTRRVAKVQWQSRVSRRSPDLVSSYQLDALVLAKGVGKAVEKKLSAVKPTESTSMLDGSLKLVSVPLRGEHLSFPSSPPVHHHPCTVLDLMRSFLKGHESISPEAPFSVAGFLSSKGLDQYVPRMLDEVRHTLRGTGPSLRFLALPPPPL